MSVQDASDLINQQLANKLFRFVAIFYIGAVYYVCEPGRLALIVFDISLVSDIVALQCIEETFMPRWATHAWFGGKTAFPSKHLSL